MMSLEDDKRFMRLALEACRRGVDKGQSPFGACIVRAGQVLATTHNHVWLATDPTAHAEVCCIRDACKASGTIHLPGATIYSTTEPCPMCFCAIHWTRIARIVYAARVQDAADFGFNELNITNAQLKRTGGAPVDLVPDFLRDESLELFRYWESRGGKAY